MRGARTTRRASATRPALVASLASVALAACWTTAEEGAAMRRQSTSIEQRVSALETGVGAEIERAHTKVAELEDVLQRATALVTSTSADTGAQVEVLQRQVATQEGAIDELRHELQRLQEEFREQQTDYESRMKQLARRAGIDMPVDDAEIPAERDAHFQAAQRAFESRELSRARALYRAYVTRYRDDARADDAQLMIGRSYMQEDRPATALGELRHVISDFASGDKVPEALLTMGEAFYRLHACGEARTALETIVSRFGRHPLAGEARRRLRDVQRAPEGYCTQ